MSKYTTEVRYICEHYAGLDNSTGYLSIDEVINKALPKVFDFDFPMFDENYRNVLESKILKHYYTREICSETVGLWKLFVNRKLNEIMPYYNQLYKSELLQFNPLYDTDITREHTLSSDGTSTTNNNNEQNTITNIKDKEITSKTENGTNNRKDNNTLKEETKTDSNNTTNGTNWDKYSDTPQGGVSNLENDTYLSNARKKTDSSNGTANQTNNVNGTSTATSDTTIVNKLSGNADRETSNNGKVTNSYIGNGSVNNTEKYLETVKGKQGGGNMSDMLMKYRQTFLNIDMLVINELGDLFFNLW